MNTNGQSGCVKSSQSAEGFMKEVLLLICNWFYAKIVETSTTALSKERLLSSLAWAKILEKFCTRLQGGKKFSWGTGEMEKTKNRYLNDCFKPANLYTCCVGALHFSDRRQNTPLQSSQNSLIFLLTKMSDEQINTFIQNDWQLCRCCKLFTGIMCWCWAFPVMVNSSLPRFYRKQTGL